MSSLRPLAVPEVCKVGEDANGIAVEGAVAGRRTGGAISLLVSDEEAGIAASNGGEAQYLADRTFVSDLGLWRGTASSMLYRLTSSWKDVQQSRLAAQQRGLDEIAAALLKIEERTAREISKALRQHAIWPWLSQFPGLGGVQTARLIALIDDPRRFPGQQCSAGHTFAPDYPVGESCPMTDKHGNGCPGRILPPRTTTGVRSLWHYLGLHVVDGRSPRKTKGQLATWSPAGRTAVLMPGGIADSIVRNRVPQYRDVYDRAKARLVAERAVVEAEVVRRGGSRAVDATSVIDGYDGSDEADGRAVSDTKNGLRPFQVDALARKIAAKEFVGDLLMAWKRAV